MQTRAVHANKATLDGKALQSELDKLGGRSTDALHRVTARSSSSVAISEERRASQTSASNSGATPVKSGGGTELGLSEVSRAHIELHERRLKSRDLIEALFGSIVDLDEAHSILLELLRTKVLSAETIGPKVGIKGKVVAVTAYKAACDHAVAQAKHFVAPTSIRSSPDKYRWKWMVPVAASEEGVALFLNVVAIAAHAAAVRSGTGNTLPCIRFLTPPNPHAAVPLSYESSQDCRPDVVGVKYDMLDTKPTKTNPNAPPRFFPLPNCPFNYIRKHFPSILRAETNTNPHRKNILAFIKWFEKQSLRTHLDLWRFCWPELRLTAEGKLNDLPSAILEELVYMQQQRRSQPWMRSVIGLVVTTDTIGVLRADSLGVEECTFKRESSRGVLDAVRLCLGLVRSNGVQRGRHEAFELGPVKTWAPPHVQTQATKQRTTQPTPTSTVAYTHRTVRFIKLDGGDKIHHPKNSTVADVRYYVHHMIQDDGSLVGRCPRIFCVSRQEKGPDDKTALFIGPYVLKIYYADHSSECFKENLIDEARKGQVQNVLLPTWEWHYGDALSKRGYGPEIVLAYKNGDAVVPHVASNREEVFAQSDLKRVLAQCTNRKEFLAAFIDFTIGIASLEEKKLIHRDISIGNVLLKGEPECSTKFWSEATACAKALLNTDITFRQRTRDTATGGLLHDLDMAGRLRSSPSPPAQAAGTMEAFLDKLEALKILEPAHKEPVGALRGFRTGTPPFMAIQLLKKGPPHLVAYDLHSLSLVAFLFLWTYDRFSDVRFPERVPSKGRLWPHEVMQWANRPVESTFANLAAKKAAFFSDLDQLTSTIHRTLSSEVWKQGSYIENFIAMYSALWKEVRGHVPTTYLDRNDTTPAEVKRALEKVLAKWEGTKDEDEDPIDKNV